MFILKFGTSSEYLVFLSKHSLKRADGYLKRPVGIVDNTIKIDVRSK